MNHVPAVTAGQPSYKYERRELRGSWTSSTTLGLELQKQKHTQLDK